MTRTALLAIAALSVATPGCGKDCIDIGCNAQLVLTVAGIDDVSGLVGTISVGGHSFGIDCAADDDPDYDCDGTTITLYLGNAHVTEPVDVTWSLTSPATDGTAADLAGDGTFRPEWEAGEYYDPDCLPECWFGSGTVTLIPAG